MTPTITIVLTLLILRITWIVAGKRRAAGQGNDMTLYLAEFDMKTVLSPSDDEMSSKVERRALRVVEAQSEDEAWRKLRGAIERYELYDIRVSIEPLEISEMIR